MIVAVITGKTKSQVEGQIKKASKDANALEIRLDYFEESFNLSDFKIPLPVILTLRSHTEGGNYKGNEETRLQEIMRFASYNPDFIDIEAYVPESFIQELKAKNPTVKIILSYHNFQETPKDLGEILRSMKKKPADFYKLAFHANSSIDALLMLQFLKTSEKNVIGISMGTYGTITRILNPWTYAYIDLPTAEGQLSLNELIDTYKFSPNENTKLFGLIGDPVEKSISHITHNDFFEKEKINAKYVKIPIKKEELQTFFQKIKDLNFQGLSVTMPLKETIIPYLDNVDDRAKAISAVNTITIKDGKLIGSNTDAEGALLALEEKTAVYAKKLIILGSGGAAKAIAYEAIQRGAFVTILNRNKKKAVDVAKTLNCIGGSLDEIADHFEKGYDIIINATSHEMPIDKKFILKNTVAMDIHTIPEWTPFLSEAQEKNCQIVFGHRMFYYQAMAQFKIWGLKNSSF